MHNCSHFSRSEIRTCHTTNRASGSIKNGITCSTMFLWGLKEITRTKWWALAVTHSAKIRITKSSWTPVSSSGSPHSCLGGILTHQSRTLTWSGSPHTCSSCLLLLSKWHHLSPAAQGQESRVLLPSRPRQNPSPCLMTPSTKYTGNLTTSHHPHYYRPGPSRRLLLPLLLQQPLDSAAGFHLAMSPPARGHSPATCSHEDPFRPKSLPCMEPS